MAGWMRMSMAVLFGVALAGVMVTGCEREDVTTQTEIKDQPFGGTEIEKKEVIEKNGKVQVRETETDLDDEGNVEERETTVKGDDLE